MVKRVLGYFYYLFHKYITKNQRKSGTGKWFYIGGRKKLLEHDFKEGDVVFEVGGYLGSYSGDLLEKYPQMNLYIFEPVPKFFKVLKRKFSKMKNVKLLNYGLAGSTRKDKFNIQDDATSHSLSGKEEMELELRDIKEVIDEYQLSEIALFNSNIEGGEYELLDRILETGIIDKIRVLQVQFHDIDAFSQEKKQNILNEIEKTHTLIFDYPTWVRLERR